MKILKKIIISVTVVMALVGNTLIDGSLSSYAKDNGFGIELVASESTTESGACVAMLDNPLQNSDCRNEKLGPADKNLSQTSGSNLNYSGSYYRNDKDEGLNQGLSRVDWSKSVASAVLNSQSDARVLSKVGLDSSPSTASGRHEQTESDSVAANGISGSLLVSILALIAIVAVARRNVTEGSD